MDYTKDGRGEILNTLDCGCQIIQDRTADAYIVYCPLHKSAPDLYEALSEIFDELCGYVELDMSLRIKQALAKVKGKPDSQDEQELDERRLDALLSK